MKHFTFFLVLIFALSACKSADKLYQQGNYKQLISKLEGKAKKGNLDRKEKDMLIKAVNKYSDQINGEVLSSLATNKPSEWIKAKKKLDKLEQTIEEVNAYSQIGSSAINPSRYDELHPKLNEKLYDHTISQYDEAIANYDETGDRKFAIQAHAFCRKLEEYGGDPKFIEQLEIQAIDLAHRTILLDIDGPILYSSLFDNHFEDELDFRNDLFNTFTEFWATEDIDYKLEIDVDIRRKDSDEKRTTDRYTERVVDYYENVVDTASNSSNKVPVYKDIEAVVETVETLWYVEGEYDYEIRDANLNRRIDYGTERHRVEHTELVHTLKSGDEDAVPSNITLSRFTVSDREAYSELIEELFNELADDFNDLRITNKLL